MPRMQQGRSEEFSKGGHTVSNIIVMTFPRNIIGCFLKKAYKGGDHGHPRTPLATPLCRHTATSSTPPLTNGSFLSCLPLKKHLSVKINFLPFYPLTIMPDEATATGFLYTPNKTQFSATFTMQTESNGMLPLFGTEQLNRAPRMETKVYVKPTQTSPLTYRC